MTLLFLALSLLVVQPVFSQSNGSIQVETNLPNAKVFIDDVFVGETTERFGKNLLVADNVKTGARRLKISLSPYSDNVRDVAVTAGETVRIVHTFQAASVQTTSQTGRIESQSKYATGTIKVVSKPIDCEMILDDGVARGRTGKDSSFLSVPVGRRKVTVKASQKDMLAIEFNLEEGQTITVTADFMASPPAISIDAVYKVIIKSVPPSSVRIDGKNQGTTPVALSLKYGQYELELERPGYSLKKERLVVSENRILEYSLSEVARVLNVTTNPPSSTVYLNGKPIGESPVKNYPISTGEHVIKVEKTGGFIPYAAQEQKFSVGIQDTQIVKELTLTARAATLAIIRDSEYSVDTPVSCNGQLIGALNKSGSALIPAGTNTIQIGNTIIKKVFVEGGTYSIKGLPVIPFSGKQYSDPFAVPGARKYPHEPSPLSEVKPVYKELPTFFGEHALTSAFLFGFFGFLGGSAYNAAVSPDDNSDDMNLLITGALIGAGGGWVYGGFTDFRRTKVKDVPDDYNINRNKEIAAAYRLEKAKVAEYNLKLMEDANRRTSSEEARIKNLNAKRGIVELIDLGTKAAETFALK